MFISMMEHTMKHNKPIQGNNANWIEHPAHYNIGKIEAIDYIEDQKLNFHLGNVVKYISRAGHKATPDDTAMQDLAKAKWYLEREITRRGSLRLDMPSKGELADMVDKHMDALENDEELKEHLDEVVEADELRRRWNA